MFQQTIKKKVSVTGIGLHKGIPITLTLEPLEEDMGIIFYRKDKGISIPLDTKYVIDTTMATVIGKNNIIISTIEHLMSAIYAYGIDNLRIILDNDEIPIMDGSAISFILLLKEAGIRKQSKLKKFAILKKEIIISENEKYVKIKPINNNIIFDYTIEFNHPIIKKQHYKFNFTTKNFIEQIAKARTFGFLKDIQYLRSKGLVLGGSLENAIVLDSKKILNDNLRYNNEFVRHKILDAIGDLSLLGKFLINIEYKSYKGSHKLNNLLVKEILKNYEIITLKKEITKFTNIQNCYSI